MSPQDLATALRADLDVLKLPHPTQGSIRGSNSGVSFSWITTTDTRLYTRVTSFVDGQGDPAIVSRKRALEIEGDIIMKIQEHADHLNSRPRTQGRLPKKPSWVQEIPRLPRKPVWVQETSSVDIRDRARLQETRELDSKTGSQHQFGNPSTGSERSHEACLPHPYPQSTSSPSKSSQEIEGFPDSESNPLSVDQGKNSPSTFKASTSAQPGTDNLISRRTRELWDTRRTIAALTSREKVITKELARLGSPYSLHEMGNLDVANIETRLRRAEIELEEERQKRIDIECIVQDVQRECAEPFIVPMLVRALDSISHCDDTQ